jgi:hypothetical protein
MHAAVERHFALLDDAIAAHHGVRFKTVGDAVQAAFPTTPNAVAAAVTAQRALRVEDWGSLGPLHVRMALHVGEATPDSQGDYLTAPLNRLSRVLASSHGGQGVLTDAVQQLVRGALPADAGLRDLGQHRLRDLLEPERIWQGLAPSLETDFPPLATIENRPQTLPRQSTPFLGREREVDQITALLRRDDVQLVTLTGPGGTGKTRLALQVAAEIVDTLIPARFGSIASERRRSAQARPEVHLPVIQGCRWASNPTFKRPRSNRRGCPCSAAFAPDATRARIAFCQAIWHHPRDRQHSQPER